MIERHLDLGDAPGRANTGDKLMTLVVSALAGGDCIDDADALRSGGTASVIGCVVKAPSTLGTFLRSFRWGHVRQLDRVSRELLAQAWKAGAGPGDAPLTIAWTPPSARPMAWPRRVPATTATPASGAITRCWPVPPTSCGRPWDGCATPVPPDRSPCGPTAASTLIPSSPSAASRRSASPPPSRLRKSLRNLVEAIPEDAWQPITYCMEGAADVAEINYTPFQSKPGAAPVRLIVRRVRPTPGSQLALFAGYSYHAFITDRDGDTLELEADHRRHAEIENAIRDLKYRVGLNHLPSGRFAANGAWLAVQVMAHNLARLDDPDRSGPAGRDRQNPPATLLLPGRTHHPQGPPPHPASAPGLALGIPVHRRPGQIARPVTPFLTPLRVSDPSPDNPTAQQAGTGGAARVCCCHLPDDFALLHHLGPSEIPFPVIATPSNGPNYRYRAQ